MLMKQTAKATQMSISSSRANRMSWRLLSLATATLTGVICAVSGFGWVTLLICVFLVSTALFRGNNGVLLWPVGLMICMLIIYASYVCAWLVGRTNITQTWSIGALLVLQVIASTSTFARTKQRLVNDVENLDNNFFTAVRALLFSIIPLAICLFATRQLLFDQINLVAGHVPGGDHGSHVGLVFGITEWGYGAVRSPFALQSYPSGIHNLVAHIVLSSSQFTSGQFFRAFLFSSWFDRIQLAAVIQLFACVAVRYWKRISWGAVIVGNVVIIAVISINRVVDYLLWSGNTTSLGALWIALVVLVIPRRTIATFALWNVVIGAAMMVVYQILVIPFVVISLIAMSPKKSRLHLSLLLPVIIVAVLHGPKNGSGSVFRVLLLPGGVLRPDFGVMIFVSILLLVSSWLLLRSKENSRVFALDAWYLIPSAISTGLISALLYRLNRSSLPYYSLKLLWHWLLIAIPVLASYLISFLMQGLQQSSRGRRFILVGGLIFAAVVVSTTGGRDPTNGLHHKNGRWFADGLNQIDTDNSRRRIIAFSALEGHYGANRALETISVTPLPRSLNMFGGITEVCQFVRTSGVDEIIVSPVDKNLLIRAGCPESGITYILGQLS